jgi:hypothetical protein
MLGLPLHVNPFTWGFHVLQWLVQSMLIMWVLAFLPKLVCDTELLILMMVLTYIFEFALIIHWVYSRFLLHGYF